MAQLKDLLVTGPARFLSKTVFSNEVDINNKVNLKDDVDIAGDVIIDGEIFSSGNITANGDITSVGNNTFTGKNIFTATTSYNTADTQKFIIGNNSSAFVFGGDGLQCFSNVGASNQAGKAFYMNYYGGPVQIGNTGQTDNFTVFKNTIINGSLNINGLSGDTPAYLKSASTGTFLGFKNSSDETLGYMGYNKANSPIAYYGSKSHQLFNGGADATFEVGSTQAGTSALKWEGINNKNPYFGYAKDQTDGTFLWSITGTNYQSGLAIGGGTGNLIWKGNRVLDTTDVTGAVSTILTSNLTANRALISNGSGKVAVSGITSTELNSLDNIEGNIHRERVSMVPRGTAVSANANLNTTTYLKVGNYYCSETNTAKTLANCPVSNAFMMQVYSPLSTTYDNETTGAWVYRLRVIQDYTGPQYVQRCSVNGTANVWTYGPWEKVVKAQNNEIQHSLGIKGGLTAESLELNGSTPYIDFHFGKSTADYTLRIIEDVSGELNFTGGSKTKFNNQAWFYKNPVIEKSTTIADDTPARLTLQVHQNDNNHTSSSTISVYDDHDTSASGLNMVIQSGSGMVIGAGESPNQVYNNIVKGSNAEQMYITADNKINFYSNVNTYADRKEAYFNVYGQFEIPKTKGCSWYQGPENAGFAMTGTSSGAYIPMLSQKTTNGSMQLGHYNSTNWHDYWTFTYTKNGATSNDNGNIVYGPKIYGPTGVLYGAAWNDYAEFRTSTEEIEPGRIVCENGDDTVSLATERLQPGALATSDTYGFAIGETERSKCPIAVAGRVLVFPYEDRDSYKPGDPVCAAPNGTVSKMTREEVMMYPDRIIGTVSAIPDYETWGAVNTLVKNRIWIKI